MAKKKESEKKEKKKVDVNHGFGIAGFVLGVESIVSAFLIPILALVFSVNGFIFCMIQQKKSPIKKARIGIILNVIGFILSVASWIIAIIVLSNLGEIFPAS